MTVGVRTGLSKQKIGCWTFKNMVITDNDMNTNVHVD